MATCSLHQGYPLFRASVCCGYFHGLITQHPLCLLPQRQEKAVESEVRGGDRERQAVMVQEPRRGATQPPRSGCCAGTGGAAVRRYPLSKVRSNGCALLEQL
ncbi:unnamed protein product [Rangifer tarandus platyrhynchus]|uniref:Uncharacterized protein n=1 Tax=Rangifer tarandus platyrhynchus TaxID=3082113 RepID=A0ABN8XR47_RANTA|nr:unnamed protein product [Rangifer tarandus platyrhynchus]